MVDAEDREVDVVEEVSSVESTSNFLCCSKSVAMWLGKVAFV